MQADTALGASCPEGLLSAFVMDLASMGDLQQATGVAKEGCTQLAASSQPLGRLVQLYPLRNIIISIANLLKCNASGFFHSTSENFQDGG